MNEIVSAWGDNSNGQLGNGGTDRHSLPVQVAGLDNVRKIEAGSGHILALLNDGTAYGWGRNAFGQCGNAATGSQETPDRVKLDGIVDIAPGGGHTLLLREDGTVWGCGAGFFGMLGTDNMRVHPVPVQVPFDAPSKIVQLVSGGSQGLALLEDGTVWSWGRDDVGQLGDGDEHGTRANIIIQAHAGREYPCRPVPAPVHGIDEVTFVAAGGGHSLAVRADGSLYAWGTNDRGQLGDGTTENRFSPTKAKVEGVRTAAGAYHHTVVALNDGTLQAFGINDKGQLGDGTTTDNPEPVEVKGLRDVKQVVTTGGGGDDNPGGHGHNLAVLADGSLWGWGCNGHGELGTGDNDDRLTPVQLDISDVSYVTVGGEVPGFRENPGGGYALAIHSA